MHHHNPGDGSTDALTPLVGTPATAVHAGSPWHLPWVETKQALKRIWLMWGFHNLSLLAAGVAFFVFLAVTPLFAAIVLLYGLVADVRVVEQQVGALARLMPPDAASVLETQLLQVITTSTSIKGVGLAFALAVSIYGAMCAANGLIAALNVLNTELETRGTIALTRRAVFLTLAAIMIGLTGLISGGVFAWLTTFASLWFGGLTVFAPGRCLAVSLPAWLLGLRAHHALRSRSAAGEVALAHSGGNHRDTAVDDLLLRVQPLRCLHFRLQRHLRLALGDRRFPPLALSLGLWRAARRSGQR